MAKEIKEKLSDKYPWVKDVKMSNKDLSEKLIQDTGINFLDYLPSEVGHEAAGNLFCYVLKSFYETGRIQSTGLAHVDSQAKLVVLEIIKSYHNEWNNVIEAVCGDTAFEFKR